jgi:hypothetical protein
MHTKKLTMVVLFQLVWALFPTDRTDNMSSLPSVSNQLNHVLGLWWKHVNGLRRSVPRTYLSKLDVLVLKNSPYQANLAICALFLADHNDNMNILLQANNQSNHVLGLQWKLPWKQQ